VTESPAGRRAVPRERLAASGVGALAATVAAALAGLSLGGVTLLAIGVFVVQVVVALAWFAALGAKGSLGGFGLAMAAAAAMDIAIGLTTGPNVGQVAPVIGLAFVASLVHQLARRPRPGVTLSLAATMSAVAFAACASAYLALLGELHGDAADAAALFGAGAALTVARAVDLVAPTPAVFPASRRGAIGVVVGAAVSIGVGIGFGAADAGLGSRVGLRMALIGALLALIADIAVDAVLVQAPPPDERRFSALTPLGVLLPVVLAGPVAYVAGRILLG
jgi:hypothetical protein